MERRKKFTFSLIVSFVIATIPLIYTVFCLINRYIVPGYLILILIVSFAISFLLALIKKIPNVIKVILSSVILLLTLAIFVFFSFFGNTVEFRTFDNAEEIRDYYSDFDFKKFGEYESISNYKYHSMSIFQQEAYTTILKYNKDNFDAEKSKIENSYKFYTMPIENEEAEPVFSYEGFDFRTEISDWYPKEMNLVGINEESHEIAYVSFQDYDLDSISDYEEFLDYYCGWRYIVKK